MKYNETQIKEDILSYLYENRDASPQSITKIRVALGFKDSKGDIRTTKECLDALLKKCLIKKQVDRGNYKIDDKGIAYMEKSENMELEENTDTDN